MMYSFFGHFFTRYPRKSQRLLEVIAPLISLFLLTMPFWGAVFFPVQLAYFIIFFDVYWLYKSVNLAMCSFIASKKIHRAETTDWFEKASHLSKFSKIYHVAIIPNYKERIEKLRATLESIHRQNFPLERIFVYVAMEKREKGARGKAHQLLKEYNSTFGGIYFTFHPDFPNEVKGKSSNQAYAVCKAYETIIKKKGLSIEQLTVSSIDADSILDRQYFSYLSYKFLTSPSPYLRFWQSANVSYNNFWEIPVFTRIIVFFGNLWRTSLLVQGLRLIPNSTYSLSFKLLRDVGYWDTDVIPEDYRIFFKAFFRLGGKVEVEPIYLKTSMDAALSHGYVKSLINRYDQERRWAWGISDDAVYLKWYLTVKNVPLFKKTYILGNVILDHILWPVNWFIITVSANVVALINPVFTRTTLGYNLPRLSGFILTLCLLAFIVQMMVDMRLRAQHSRHVSKKRQILLLPQFVFMPIAGFFLNSLPALVSHVQLLLGKRLEYKVTEKV